MMSFIVFFCVINFLGCDASQENKHSGHHPVTQNKKITSFLYDGSQISKLLIDRNGYTITPLDFQINTERGVEFDPVENLLLWNEDNVLHVQNISSLKTEQETIWVPDRVGHIFHYDWSNKNMYWYPEGSTPSKGLRMMNLNSRFSTVIQILEMGTLKAMDSFNQVLFYEFDDSIKLYSMNDLQNIKNFTFDGDFNIMDVAPHSKYMVVCVNPTRTVKEDMVYTYRFLGYDGSEKFSIRRQIKYDQIFMEDDSIIYKQKDEIGVINKTSGETLFSVNNPLFWNKTLKLVNEVQDRWYIKPLSSTSAMECTDDDTNEICFHVEGGSELQQICSHQAFIISDGTSFKYYNPASGSQPFHLPFPLNGTIRAFATYLKKRLFWIDGETNLIMGTHLYSHDNPIVIGGRNSEFPYDIKVDEYRRNVFWTDRDKGTIEVVDFEGKYHRVLFQSLNMPTKLILALDYGYVIWAEGALNNIVKAGRIVENAQKVLLESKGAIFGFVLDYIYDILYVGSQNEHLYLEAFDLNLGYKSELYKSRSSVPFSYMELSSTNYLYLMEPNQFWKFNVCSLSLDPIHGTGLNASLISPLRCPTVKDVGAQCLECKDFCFPVNSTSFLSNVNWQCYNADYISLRESKCFDTSAGFMLVSTDSAVYVINEYTFTKVYDLNPGDVSEKNPIAFDKSQNRLFIASKSGNSTSFILSDPCTQPEGEEKLLHHPIGAIGGLMFNDQGYLITSDEYDISYLDPYSSIQKINSTPIESEYQIHTLFSVPNEPILYIARYNIYYNQWSLIVWNIENNEMRRTFSIVDSEEELQLSHSENRMFMWRDKSLESLYMEGKYRSSIIVENMPEFKTFTILDNYMYFVSQEDQMLYRLDYLSKSKSITPILNVPRNIKYFLNVEK